MEIFSADTQLQLFQSGMEGKLPKGVLMIQSMIELDYLDATIHQMRFTEAGVDYMFQNHRTFLRDIAGKDVDFGEFGAHHVAELQELAMKYGLDPKDMVLKFQLTNLR